MSLWISSNMNSNIITRYHLVPNNEKAYLDAVKKISSVDLELADSLKAGSEIDLLKLFDRKTSPKDWLMEFNLAESVLYALFRHGSSSNAIRCVSERIWPDFTTFSIDVLSNASLLSECSLDVSKMLYAEEIRQSLYGYTSKETEDLRYLQKCADSNGKVLRLAKAVHEKCFSDNK